MIDGQGRCDDGDGDGRIIRNLRSDHDDGHVQDDECHDRAELAPRD